MRKIFRVYVLFLLVFFMYGCASTTQDTRLSPEPLSGSTAQIKPPKQRKLLAITGFENKSTYSSDKLWDTSSRLLFTNLIEMGYFRVVEWEKMKQLFDWEALSTSTLVKNPEKRNEVRKILLCEYFLTGAVTYFDVSQRAQVSALSKSKVIETTIRVDLLLQDAQTGEYVSAAKGEATERQEFSGGPLGGRTGSWDPKSADRALNNAIHEALARLTSIYGQQQ